MNVSPLCRIVGASLLGLAAQAAVAQSRPPTTEQLGRDPGALRQEAEQQRAQQQRDQQRQSQQQADQQYNDTLRQQQSRAAGDMAQGEAVRRTWQQRPPLAPENNPLLGRWESLGTGQRKNGAPGLSPEMAQIANTLLGSLTSGLCDSMLGRGTVEFRPMGVVAIGGDGLARAGGGGTARAAMASTSHGPPTSVQDAAQVGPYGGSWHTRWGGGQQDVLDLLQIGSEVTGHYAGTSQGKVTGRITGKVLTGNWSGSAPGDDCLTCSESSSACRSCRLTWARFISAETSKPRFSAQPTHQRHSRLRSDCRYPVDRMAVRPSPMAPDRAGALREGRGIALAFRRRSR
jgi:hypothetical protein